MFSKKKVLSVGLGVMIAATGAFGLTGCASGSDAETVASESTTATVDVAADLESARQVILDSLAEDDSWGQIMLASDVKAPTVKYGLLVVPFTPSEASARVQGTITIDDGKFTIDAESADTGLVWTIDQDGSVTEGSK